LPWVGFVAALVGVFAIWSDRLVAPTLRGRVEAVHADVTSPQPGLITEVKVARFQKVARGEPVAVITPNDPRLQFALVQSGLDVLRTRLEPRLNQQRNATDYERLRLEWLLQKVDLAAARVDLARAENELRRDEQLFQAKLISEQLYDFTLKTRDEKRTEVEERAKVIADLEQSLQQLKMLGDPQAPPVAADAILDSLKAQEERLHTAEGQLEPITLKAPIDGMVSAVYRQAGENVQDGEPIISLNAVQPDHIVGYLRQPFPVQPELGMAVEVLMRYPKPSVHEAQVLQVGSQFEPITNSLAIVRPGALVDLGLPIKISWPADLKARPGEVVDLVFRPQTQ
jgi:multidrug resistance efflux pump